MKKICLIHTSVNSMAEASMLAAGLIEMRLVACVQITGAGLSVYRWKGKVEQADEYYINIKTSSACSEDVINWLKQHHPYELPEIIQVECDATAAYADWVGANSLGVKAS